MDLLKSIELCYLRKGEENDIQTIEFFYRKSQETNDCDKKEIYANRALFKSSEMGIQEFLKFNQREFDSGTISITSGMAVTTINRGDFGISSSILFGREISHRSYNYVSDLKKNVTNYSDSGLTLLGTNDSSFKFLTEFPESRNPDTILEIYSFLRNLINNKSEKLFVAFLLFTSEYDRWLTESQSEFFIKELNFLNKIQKDNGKVNYCNLWTEQEDQINLLGYNLTRYKIKVAKADILKRASQLEIKQSIHKLTRYKIKNPKSNKFKKFVNHK